MFYIALIFSHHCKNNDTKKLKALKLTLKPCVLYNPSFAGHR